MHFPEGKSQEIWLLAVLKQKNHKVYEEHMGLLTKFQQNQKAFSSGKGESVRKRNRVDHFTITRDHWRSGRVHWNAADAVTG